MNKVSTLLAKSVIYKRHLNREEHYKFQLGPIQSTFYSFRTHYVQCTSDRSFILHLLLVTGTFPGNVNSSWTSLAT